MTERGKTDSADASMTWPRRLAVAGIVVSLGVAAAASYAVRVAADVPEFYRVAATPPEDPDGNADAVEAEGEQLARLFGNRRELVDTVSPEPADAPAAAVPSEADRVWTFRATADQLNAWLARELGPGGLYWDYVPIGLSTPRLGFEEGAVAVGVRYERGEIGGVLSARLRGEPETDTRVRFDVDRVRVGGLPATAILRAVADELGPTLDVPPESVRIGKAPAGGGISVWLELAAMSDAPPAVEAIEVTGDGLTVRGRLPEEGELPEGLEGDATALAAR